MSLVGARHGLAAQQITAVAVAERQRLAMGAITGQEPALEVDAPHVVGCLAVGKRSARGRTAATQPALDRQSLAVEQRPDRAHCRPGDLRCAPFEPSSHLYRPPGRMRPPHRQTVIGDLLRYRLRMIQRRPRPVRETLNARLSIASKPFVAGLPAYPEAPTHRCKRLFLPLNRHHEAHPLIHGTGLHPSHRQGPPRRSVELSPMASVYSVTHVAGLDPLPTLPPRGAQSAHHSPPPHSPPPPPPPRTASPPTPP